LAATLAACLMVAIVVALAWQAAYHLREVPGDAEVGKRPEERVKWNYNPLDKHVSEWMDYWMAMEHLSGISRLGKGI
jgi:hypothetical protein